MNEEKLQQLETRLEAAQKELASIRSEMDELRGIRHLPPLKKETKKEESRWKKPDFEVLLGGNLLGKAGLLAIVIATAWFVKFAFDNQWFNESGRIYVGLLLGFITILAGSYSAQKQYRYIPGAILGSGVSILYISISSAYYFYDLVGIEEAFLYLALLTIVTSLFASWVKNQTVYIFGSIGSIVLPVILSTGENSYRFLFSYLTIINLVYLYIGSKNNWKIAPYLAFMGNAILYTVWSLSELQRSSFFFPFLYIIITFAIFFVRESYFYILLTKNSSKSSSFLVFLFSIWFSFAGYTLFLEFHPNLVGHFFLLMSFILLGVFFASERAMLQAQIAIQPPIKLQQTSILFLFLVSIFASLTEFSYDQWTTASWVALAGLVSMASIYSQESKIKIISYILWVIACSRLYFYETEINEGYLLVWNPRFAIFLLASILAGVSYYIQKISSQKQSGVLAIFAFINIIIGSLVENRYYISDIYYRNLGYSYILGIYSFLCLLPGFIYKQRDIRITGIIIAILLVLKLYTYDIWQMSLGVRIIAGFSLGLSLVLLSVFYQKYKSKIFEG